MFTEKKLNYCNSLYFGLSKHMIATLHGVQNTTVRLVTSVGKVLERLCTQWIVYRSKEWFYISVMILWLYNEEFERLCTQWIVYRSKEWLYISVMILWLYNEEFERLYTQWIVYRSKEWHYLVVMILWLYAGCCKLW